GARLEAQQPPANDLVHAGVDANIEMQEGKLLEAAPVSAVEDAVAGEVEGPGDDPVTGEGLDELDPVPEVVQHPVEEPGVQVPAPPGELVDGAGVQPEGFAGVDFGESVTAQNANLQPLFRRGASLALQLVPSLAGEAPKDVLGATVVLVDEVVLDAVADGEPERLDGQRLGLGRKQHVNAGQPLLVGELQRPACQLQRPGRPVLARRDQEAASGRGGQRRGNDELRVVGDAGPLRGGGPGEVEDEFAAAVGLEVRRCGRNEPVASPQSEVTWLPARGGTDASARLEGLPPAPLPERGGVLVAQRGPGRLRGVGE